MKIFVRIGPIIGLFVNSTVCENTQDSAVGANEMTTNKPTT